VEENAATAKTLEHQAKSMDEQIAFFQIGNGGAGAHDSEDGYGRRPVAATATRRASAA